MKKLLLFLLIPVANCLAQTVNNIPLKDINVEYVQIVGTTKPFTTKVIIQIDFGQRDRLFDTNDTVIKDAEGKRLELNSMIDALNYMTQFGYEFVQAYAFSTGNQNVYHYLLRKKKVEGTKKE